MYEIIKNVITFQNYDLNKILEKIEKVWLEDKITDGEKTELIELAREKAVAQNSYLSENELFEKIYIRLSDLADKVAKIENEILTLKGEVVPPVAEEEYPEFVQPTGAHDAYNAGDKITYNGKRYICLMDGCVWNPGTYPQGWQEVTEEGQEA